MNMVLASKQSFNDHINVDLMMSVLYQVCPLHHTLWSEPGLSSVHQQVILLQQCQSQRFCSCLEHVAV